MHKANVLILVLLLSSTLFAGLITGKITDDNRVPLEGANVMLENTILGTDTDSDGLYIIRDIPEGRYTLTASYIGYEPFSTVVVIDTERLEVNFSLVAEKLEGLSISVIGSRFARTAEEQSVPVDVYTETQIRQSGYTETAQVIQSLAPSFNLPRTSITDGSDAVRPMTLRGLSSGQVLVLVNGKRRHTTALVHLNNSPSRGDTGVVLNTIPVSAIERIEVLRDGAAAQYGSDAIAGVLNIILKTGSQGGSFSLTSGQSYHTTEAIPAGFDLYNWASGGEPYEWNPTGDVVYSNDETGHHAFIDGSEDYTVTDGEVMTLSLNQGFEFGEKGYLNVSGEYRHRGSANRVGFEGERYYMPESDYWTDNEAEANRLNPGSDYYIDPKRMLWGEGGQDNYYAFFNASLPVGASRFYSFGGYSLRKSDAGCFTRQPDQADKVWLAYNPTGYVPRIKPDISDYSFAAGFTGIKHGWSYDASTVMGGNDFHYKLYSTNASFPPSGLSTIDIGGFNFTQWTNNLDLTSKFGDMDVAMGMEFRSEAYRIYAGEQESYASGNSGLNVVGWNSFTDAGNDSTGIAYADTFVVGLESSDGAGGCQCFSGFKPSNEQLSRDADRTNLAFYADMETELLEDLRAGIAIRYENYSDFGGTFNYKLTSRYEILPGIIARSAFSTGFRAPALAQSYQSKVATNFLPDPVTGETVAFEVGTFPVSHPFSRALGAKDLEPEKSVNISAGLSMTILEGLRINFDYYHVTIDDRIVLSGNFQANEEGNLDADNDGEVDDALGYRVWELLDQNEVNATGGRFFTNAVNTTTAGIDITLNYGLDLSEWGFTDITVSYNSTETTVDDIYTPELLSGLGAEAKLFDDREKRTMETAQPKDNFIFGVTWTNESPLSIRGKLHRYGEYSSRFELDNGNPQWFSAETILNLEASYSLDQLTFTLGADNILDEMPDKMVMSSRVNDGAFVYPNHSPFGMNGRFVFLKILFDF